MRKTFQPLHALVAAITLVAAVCGISVAQSAKTAKAVIDS